MNLKKTFLFVGAITFFFYADAQYLSGNIENGIGSLYDGIFKTYTCEWKNGRQNGLGMYAIKDGSFYYGHFLNGKEEGKGIYYNNKSKITTTGIFRDGIIAEKQVTPTKGCLFGDCENGIGVFFYPDGARYFGQWKNGFRNGYGRSDYPNADYYIGEQKNGMIQGLGAFISPDGTTNAGYFENNVLVRKAGEESQSSKNSGSTDPKAFTAPHLSKPGVSSVVAKSGCIVGDCENGWGTYVWDIPAEYTGEWQNGKPNGFGTYDNADGSYHCGYFVNGVAEGKGIYHSGDRKTILTGIFHEANLKESQTFESSGCLIGNCTDSAGLFLFNDYSTYLGQFSGGKFSGLGRLDQPDGEYYTGEFKNGYFEGRGTYVVKDGTAYDGIFVNGNQDSIIASLFPKRLANRTKPGSEKIIGAYKDLCSLLKEVVKSLPDGFRTIQGVPLKSEGTNQWASTIYLGNGYDPVILPSLQRPDMPAKWLMVEFVSDDEEAAAARYRQTITGISNCSLDSVTLTSSERHDKIKGVGENYTTIFKPGTTNGGLSSSYPNLEIKAVMKKLKGEKDWYVEVWVVDTTRGF